MPVPLWHAMLGHPLRLMSDKQKYKLQHCNPEAGGCVTVGRSTQPALLKIFKYNQKSPKAMKPKVCCPTLLFVPEVFRAALTCPGLVMDSPRSRPCRASRTIPSLPLAILLSAKGVWGKDRGTESQPCCASLSISPAPQWAVCQLVYSHFLAGELTDPAATGFGWDGEPLACPRVEGAPALAKPPTRLGVT